ncbi:YceI family protein [uncultured Stenotrophomonas sp.]|uniref:YceI family protein n=1 Tax=uncultured Stenotrophomonas sp. TaxID=165438 RepID=UPI0028E2EED4|nr:YceI family protein [uncultured Stenotrophomonas sp.]
MKAVRTMLGCLLGLAAASALAEPPVPFPSTPANPLAAPVQPPLQVLQVDAARSHFGFEIRTRLGQRIEGVFPRFEGRVDVLPDGRHQVHLRMFSRYVEIPGKERYTAWMRGEEFFDSARYPVVEFDSRPYWPDPVHQGGVIEGQLILRGVSHPEVLKVEPAVCPRAGYDCDVVSRGTVQRGRYGMDSWQLALSDRVTFVLRARLHEAPKP